MRLVCPKCAAQYEVDDSAIPPDGRDVQCASCGNTWFQEHPKAAATDAPAQPAADPAEPVADDGQTALAPPEEDEDKAPASPDDRPEESAEAGLENTPPAPAPDEPPLGAPRRNPHDPTVLDILRREAARETSAREAEGVLSSDADEEIHTAPEPAEGTKAAPDEAAAEEPPTPEAPPRIDPEPTPELAPEPAPERDHDTLTAAPRPAPRIHRPSRELPDVNDLNTTLRPNTAPPPDTRRSGRLGFYLALLIMLALLGVYALQPQIERAFPATGPALASYSAVIDSLRRAIANGANAFVALIRNLLSQLL